MRRAAYITIIVIAILGLIVVYKIYDMTLGNFWTTKTTLTENLGESPQIIRIDIDEEAEVPHTIDLKLSGYVDGLAILSYGWTDTTIYIKDTVNEGFNLDYTTDWYSDSCFIFYTPLTSKEGRLEINSRIYSRRK